MATEFLHLPKIPLHATPARERGPHAQAGTNPLASGAQELRAHALQTPVTGNAHCSVGKHSQAATGAESKTGSKASSSSTSDEGDHMTAGSGFQASLCVSTTCAAL